MGKIESDSSTSRSSHRYLAFLLRDEYIDIQRAVDDLKDKQRSLIDRTIAECSHPIVHIRKKPYNDKGWIGCDRPWLICAACGLTEEGWGCGYKELKHADYKDVPQISREMWLEMRTRSVFQDGRVV